LGVIGTAIYLIKKFQKEITKSFDKEEIRKMSAAFGQNLKESKLNEIANMMKKRFNKDKEKIKKKIDNNKKKK
jgi:uncharacterized protein YneF (UPF0154 family)